jgi:predicted metal-dependent peptidase
VGVTLVDPALIREQEERVANCRAAIMINYPFFGYLLVSLHIFAKDIEGLTMATDGNEIIYNPAWLKSLTNDQVVFAFCHEVLHCAFEHLSRKGDRQLFIWNMAVDIITNELLAQNRIGTPPANVVNGKDFLGQKYQSKLTDKSSEEIYRLLINNAQQITMQCNGQSPNFDQHCEPNGNGNENGKEKSAVEKGFSGKKHKKVNWNARLAQAAVFAKSRGNVPSGIECEMETVVKGFFPWQRILADLINETMAFDTTFNRVNRRYIARGYRLPGIEKSGISVVVAIDTSGSINDNEARVFIGETFSLLSQFPRVKMAVIQCDAAVQSVVNYTNWDSPPKTFDWKGRGGTDFRPVFKHVKENMGGDSRPDAIIYLTDGYGAFPQKDELGIPTFWVFTTKNVKPTFGHSIYFPPITRSP